LQLQFLFFCQNCRRLQNRMASPAKRRKHSDDTVGALTLVVGCSAYCANLPASSVLTQYVETGALVYATGSIMSLPVGVSRSLLCRLVWMAEKQTRANGASSTSVVKKHAARYFDVSTVPSNAMFDYAGNVLPARESLDPRVATFTKSFGTKGRFRSAGLPPLVVKSLATAKRRLQELRDVPECQSVHHGDSGSAPDPRFGALRYNLCSMCWQQVSKGALVPGVQGYSSVVKADNLLLPTKNLLARSGLASVTLAFVVGTAALDTLAQLKMLSAEDAERAGITTADMEMFGLLAMSFPHAVPMPNTFSAMRMLNWWQPDFALNHVRNCKRLAQTTPEYRGVLAKCACEGAVQVPYTSPRSMAELCSTDVHFVPLFLMTACGWLVHGPFAWLCKTIFYPASSRVQLRYTVTAVPRASATQWRVPAFGKVVFKANTFTMSVQPFKNTQDLPVALVATVLQHAVVAARHKVDKMIPKLVDKDASLRGDKPGQKSAAIALRKCLIVIEVNLEGCPFAKEASVSAVQNPVLMLALAEFYRKSGFADQLPAVSLLYSWMFGLAASANHPSVGLVVGAASRSPLMNPALTEAERSRLRSPETGGFAESAMQQEAGIIAAAALVRSGGGAEKAVESVAVRPSPVLQFGEVTAHEGRVTI
jgi:hypothetical protein